MQSPAVGRQGFPCSNTDMLYWKCPAVLVYGKLDTSHQCAQVV